MAFLPWLWAQQLRSWERDCAGTRCLGASQQKVCWWDGGQRSREERGEDGGWRRKRGRRQEGRRSAGSNGFPKVEPERRSWEACVLSPPALEPGRGLPASLRGTSAPTQYSPGIPFYPLRPAGKPFPSNPELVRISVCPSRPSSPRARSPSPTRVRPCPALTATAAPPSSPLRPGMVSQLTMSSERGDWSGPFEAKRRLRQFRLRRSAPLALGLWGPGRLPQSRAWSPGEPWVKPRSLGPVRAGMMSADLAWDSG